VTSHLDSTTSNDSAWNLNYTSADVDVPTKVSQIATIERQSLIVTTNLPFENWTEVLGSERLTGATLDRLTHRCHILEAAGDSYRLRDAKRRRTKRSSDGPSSTK
jgi:hypothetical protein